MVRTGGMCDGELKQPHHDKQCAKVVQTLALQNSDHLCLSHTKAKTGKNYYLYVWGLNLLCVIHKVGITFQVRLR